MSDIDSSDERRDRVAAEEEEDAFDAQSESIGKDESEDEDEDEEDFPMNKDSITMDGQSEITLESNSKFDDGSNSGSDSDSYSETDSELSNVFKKVYGKIPPELIEEKIALVTKGIRSTYPSAYGSSKFALKNPGQNAS